MPSQRILYPTVVHIKLGTVLKLSTFVEVCNPITVEVGAGGLLEV